MSFALLENWKFHKLHWKVSSLVTVTVAVVVMCLLFGSWCCWVFFCLLLLLLLRFFSSSFSSFFFGDGYDDFVTSGKYVGKQKKVFWLFWCVFNWDADPKKERKIFIISQQKRKTGSNHIQETECDTSILKSWNNFLRSFFF